MSKSSELNLNTIKEPKFVLIIDNERKEFDPWVTSDALDKSIKAAQKEGAEGWESLGASADRVRKIFGFPSSDEVASAPDGTTVKTISAHQCMEIQAALAQFINDLDVSKKLRSLSQS
jgi:hypothetical protein